MDIEDRVKEVFAEQFGIEKAELNGASTLDGLGADSLDLVEVCMGLEDEFEVEIVYEDAAALKTVADFSALVSGQMVRRQA